MICPACDGEKRIAGMGCTGKGCKPMILDCFQCKGTGEITLEMFGWMQLGAAMRAERILRGVGLREEAKRRGMLPSELAAMENGRKRPVEAPSAGNEGA